MIVHCPQVTCADLLLGLGILQTCCKVVALQHDIKTSSCLNSATGDKSNQTLRQFRGLGSRSYQRSTMFDNIVTPQAMCPGLLLMESVCVGGGSLVVSYTLGDAALHQTVPQLT